MVGVIVTPSRARRVPNQASFSLRLPEAILAAAGTAPDVLQTPAGQLKPALPRCPVAWRSASKPPTQMPDCQLTPTCAPATPPLRSNVLLVVYRRALVTLWFTDTSVPDRPQL